MTVIELIVELETIESENLEVVIEECYDWGDIRILSVETVLETKEYFEKAEEGGYVVKIKLCIELLP